MDYYEKGLSIIKGYKKDENENIADFWFKNKKELLKNLYKKEPSFGKNTGYLEEFEVKLRWESNLGKTLRKAILNYITEEKNKNDSKKQQNFKEGIYNLDLLELKFETILFEYNNKIISISSFADIYETNSRRMGILDLRGINLSEIKLNNCVIKHVNFNYSSFFNSSLQFVFLENVVLSNCNFSKSHFSGVTFSKNSSLYNSNFNGAYVDFSIDNNYTEINYNKINYFDLLKCYHTGSFKLESFTEFNLSKVDIEKCQNLETKLYIIWFVNIKNKILKKNKKKSFSNIGLFLEIILTKYWSSYITLFCSTIIINLIFSFLYFVFRNNFYINESLINHNSFITYLYYSFITFTTLGYGDIIPNSDFLRILVILEVIIGYSILGIFVLLLGNKINSKLSN